MKKIIFMLSVIFLSCISLVSVFSQQANYQRYWRFGEFTNQWGDKTGEFYMVYQQKLKGTFSNDTVRNAELIIDRILFSNEYSTFNLLKEGNERAFIGLPTSEVSVTIRGPSFGEKTFNANITNNSSTTIIIRENLAELFSVEERINFRITVTVAIIPNYYQFEFIPNAFNAAYTRLKELGKE